MLDRRPMDAGPPRRMHMGMDGPRDRDGMGPRGRDRERERDGMQGFGGPGMPRNFGRAPSGPGMGMGGPHGGYAPLRNQPPPEPAFEVDREKTCPLLLRVWTKNGSHHRVDDFAGRGKEPPGDIQVYTWMDANLRELSDLIKEVKPEARRAGSRLSFSLIYPDRQGRNVMRKVGMVHSSRHSDDDYLTLKSLKFQTGDFLDVAILSGF